MSFSSVFAGYTSGDIAASFVFAVVFAVLGYRMSWRHRVVRGVTPWRVPSAVWAVICFFLQPFGIIVELLAQFTTKPSLPTGPAPRMTNAFPGYPTQSVAPGGEPSYPTVSAPVMPIVPAGPPPPAGDGSGHTPLFGWYPDVTGRHEQRYWDGRGWSALVRDHGVEGSDPI
jgi:hypothetical protein